MIGVGDTLNNRYQLLSLEGEGGMASVYKAHDLKLKRTVAVKVLRAGEEANEAFQREAQAAAGIPHPNIVAVYDIGQDGDAAYIVMEYVQGPTLQEVIHAEAPFYVGRALDIAAQICTAVEFIHHQGIIHCDLKPLNILILADGQVKITDFGIAQRLETGALHGGKSWGTPHYAAPEVISGKPISPAADVYAIGIILYEMLTGKRPFNGPTAAEIARQHVLNAPPPVEQVNPRIPRYVRQVLDRALDKDPDKRYRTAGQMGQLLSSYRQRGEAITQPLTPVSTPQPTVVEPQVATSQPAAQTGPLPAAAPVVRFDWTLFILGIVALIAVMGLIPLWGTVVTRALTPPTPMPTVDATATPTPTWTPQTGSGPIVDPTFTPTVPPEERVLVPELVGKPFEEAEQLAQESKLILAVLESLHDMEVAVNHVISQTIAAGEQVAINDEIGVTISLGPPMVIMPNAIGFPVAIKQLDLEDLGLTVTLTETRSFEPKGLVIDQIPPADTEILAGSTVTLTISSGAEGEVRANLDYKLILISCEFNAQTLHPGDRLELTLTWEMLDRLAHDYKLFVHIADTNGNIATQIDQPPRSDRPTSTWQIGETLSSIHTLTLPANTAPGIYTVRLGLYKDNQRLRVVDAGLASAQSDAIIVGEIEVR
ncbi:MAG: protein kinase [Anaerolineae bacterium]|nr:protein kinase [Anaerolineae bacterium]